MMLLKKRHSFILLETLLTIAIIALTSTTLLHTPAKVYQKNLKTLMEIELSRAAQTLFIEIESGFEKSHPWDLLKKEQNKTTPLQEISISIFPYIKKSYKSAYQVIIDQEKEGESGMIYRLLNCHVHFYQANQEKPIASFSYLLFVTKKSAKSASL